MSRAQDFQGAAIMALCACMAAALVVWSYRLRGEESDAAARAPASACTIVLVDETDPLTVAQHELLRQQLVALVRALTLGERLEVWSLGSYPEGPLCRRFACVVPKRSAGWFTENQRLLQAQFDSLLTTPVLRLADTLGTSSAGAPTSPLIEALQELSELPTFAAATERHLVVVSDLLQHSAIGNQYRWGRGSTANGGRPQARLEGAIVTVWYLTRHRDVPFQGEAHRRFWRTYFSACGADSVALEHL